MPRSRLNITMSDGELDLLRSVVPPRRLSQFIRTAALEKARELRREQLRGQILAAYRADPEFVRAGTEWDIVSEEGWPEP